jgi:hypothetical protein
MNIFVLDLNPRECAKSHCDKHVVKMILESAQLLCSAHPSGAPYKHTHFNHPCAKWVRHCIENYNWLLELALELCIEYTNRYKRTHLTEAVLMWLAHYPPPLPSLGATTEYALAMPDEYKCEDAVKSYRQYYRSEKLKIATWTNSPKPLWL